MNEPQFVLRIPEKARERECVFQPKLRPKRPQRVKKLDGFAVTHLQWPVVDVLVGGGDEPLNSGCGWCGLLWNSG